MNGNNHHDDQYKIQAAKQFAMTLHDTWGVGNTSCGGSGLLLFLSIKDHVLYLSTSPGIMYILTSARIDTLIEDMEEDLREEEYNQAILEAIQKIQYYLDMGPPSFFERNGGWMIMSAILSLFVACTWWKERNKREYVKVHLQLKKLDQAKALSLMGKYQCNSCPICFHEFQEITNVDWIDKNNDAEIDLKGKSSDAEIDLKDKNSPPPPSSSSNGFRGCDEEPIQLLQCGHAFCKTCFQDWIKSGSRMIHQCPVCKQDIGQSKSSSSRIGSSTHLSLDPRSRGPVEIQPLVIPLQNDLYHHPPSSSSSHYYSRNDEYGRYRSERNFRIHRLHHRYPRFVNQDMLHRWTTNDYDGNLADDQIFVNMRPTEPNSSTQQHYSGNHDGQSSFGSFGGGSSGGGGGGTW